MLKVSAKSARRVKPRKVWLELGSETPEDGEIGLEVGVGVVGGQDVKLCWEKNGRGLGKLSLSLDETKERDELISQSFVLQDSLVATTLLQFPCLVSEIFDSDQTDLPIELRSTFLPPSNLVG